MMRLYQALVAGLMSTLLALTGVAADPIRGAGSTFAAPIIQKWAQNYRTLRSDGGDFSSSDWTVDYELVGSLAGMLRLSQPEMDFAATDAPLPPEELKRRDYSQFPIVIGGVAVVVSLDGVSAGQLKLSPDVIADIYRGAIRNWSDPRVKSLNPALALPELEITVVHRRDGSGTTQTFTEYLSKGSAAWRSSVGSDTLVRWPMGIGADGSQAMVERVRNAKGAIGYVEYGQVRRAGLAYAEVMNNAGRFVRPEASAFQAAASAADWQGSTDFYLRLTETSDPAAYPISAATFALVPRSGRSAVRARRTLDFFRTALDQGGVDAIALGYVPMPESVVAQIRRAWARDFKSGR